MTLDLVLVAAAVLVGAGTQRITGMGFALMASPLLVLVLGVDDGVGTSQALTLVASVIVLTQLWRSVEWGKAGLLFASSVVGVVPGAWVTRQLSEAVLAILVGGLVIVALVAVLMDERARVFRGTAGGASAGFLSGFMNVTAGVGGPPIVLYRLSTDWSHTLYVATVQVYFIGLNVASLALRGRPDLDQATWVAVLGALVVGLVVGDRLADHVSDSQARALIAVVALGGALSTVVKGVLGL
ncbi:MAG: sulfite exporter TauE/SafE family protein [Actinomycetota bacterium]